MEAGPVLGLLGEQKLPLGILLEAMLRVASFFAGVWKASKGLSNEFRKTFSATLARVSVFCGPCFLVSFFHGNFECSLRSFVPFVCGTFEFASLGGCSFFLRTTVFLGRGRWAFFLGKRNTPPFTFHPSIPTKGVLAPKTSSFLFPKEHFPLLALAGAWFARGMMV